MDKKWWVIWKSLKQKVIFFIFLIVHAQAQSNPGDCNLDLVRHHPVLECVQRFEQKLASLNQSEIKQGEDEFKQLEERANITDSIFYGYLFKLYPHPKVLFSQLKLGVKLKKSNPNYKFGYDCMDCKIFNELYLNLAEYQIVIGMLKNKKQRGATEQNMLTQSQYYAQCLRSVLDDLEHNPDKIITNKEITEQCYADSF